MPTPPACLPALTYLPALPYQFWHKTIMSLSRVLECPDIKQRIIDLFYRHGSIVLGSVNRACHQLLLVRRTDCLGWYRHQKDLHKRWIRSLGPLSDSAESGSEIDSDIES